MSRRRWFFPFGLVLGGDDIPFYGISRSHTFQYIGFNGLEALKVTGNRFVALQSRLLSWLAALIITH